MCALRVLSAGVPYLCFMGPGNGFAARADLPDEDSERGRGGNECKLGKPLRQLPGLHGLHDGVPFGRGLRKTHRGHTRANRTKDGALAGRKTPSTIHVRDVHSTGTLAENAFAIADLSKIGIASGGARIGSIEIAA